MSAQINFHKLSIGGGAGITWNRGDLNSPSSNQCIIGNADYYLTPFVYGGLEVQTGKISGQEDSRLRHFQNSYKSIIVSGKIHLGQFTNNIKLIKHELLDDLSKGIYVGTGAGIIKNSQTQIYRDKSNSLTQGTDYNKEVFIPIIFGIDNSGFNSRLIAGLRYQANYVLGDHVDGYYSAGSRNDFYSTINFTLKYKFGPTGIF